LAQTVGFIGGTGPEGKGLAARLAKAGLAVFIGSRAAERGQQAAQEVAAAAGGSVHGGTNADAVRSGEVIIVTTPFAALPETLTALEPAIGDRTVVSTVVPLAFTGGRPTMLPTEAGSAAADTQLYLPRARVVGAFQNLSAQKLTDLDHDLDGDVIVCSDHPAALREVMELVALIPGIRGVNGGPLANSHHVEGITALLVSINRIYRAETHVRILGI